MESETTAGGKVVTWYMTEFPAVNEVLTAAWYVDRWGFEIERHDQVHSFIVIRQGERRLAFKKSSSIDRTAILHVEVKDLHTEIERLANTGDALIDAVKSSDEGYQRIKVNDPDGRTVVIFEWIQGRQSTDLTSPPSA